MKTAPKKTEELKRKTARSLIEQEILESLQALKRSCSTAEIAGPQNLKILALEQSMQRLTKQTSILETSLKTQEDLSLRLQSRLEAAELEMTRVESLLKPVSEKLKTIAEKLSD